MPRLTTLVSPCLLAAGAFFAVLLTGIAPAPAKAQDTYSWTFDRKKGDTEKFRTYIKISGKTPDGSKDFAFDLNSVSHHEYKDVSPEGAITYDQIDDKRELIAEGKVTASKPEDLKPVTVTIGKNGVLLKRVNSGADPTFNRQEKTILAIQSLPTPDKPVKVGDSWKAEIANPVLKGRMLTITSTLAGVEKFLNTDALKVNLEMEIATTFSPTDRDIIKVTETYYLDAKTHLLLRAVYNIKNPLLPFPGMNMSARVLVTRIVPGVNDNEDADAEKLLTALK